MHIFKIWIGVITSTEEEYLTYFDEYQDPCGFCKDIEEEEYDPDFIGIIPLFDELVDIEILANETPLSIENIQRLVDDCQKMGISKGNAIVFYSGDTRKISKGEVFGQLIFIGEYS